MSDKESLHSFYLKIMMLIHKVNENKELSAKQQKMMRCLDVVIPLFNDLMEKENIITIRDVTEQSIDRLADINATRWYATANIEDDEPDDTEDNLFVY
jgi:hypothetical protein